MKLLLVRAWHVSFLRGDLLMVCTCAEYYTRVGSVWDKGLALTDFYSNEGVYLARHMIWCQIVFAALQLSSHAYTLWAAYRVRAQYRGNVAGRSAQRPCCDPT